MSQLQNPGFIFSVKPPWLKKKISLNSDRNLKTILRWFCLHTVCEESRCPNISECFSSKVATFLILGNICTRSCSFCAVTKSKPKKPSSSEPQRIVDAIRFLKLNYLVLTSPSRDDLSDGGAGYFCRIVKKILSLTPKRRVEILIPDFLGKVACLKKIAGCGAAVIAHNLETVPRLYPQIRPGADYFRSLKVLETIKRLNSRVFTKSGLMLGLGEEEREVKQTLAGLLSVGCDFLTLGQYLPPSLKHYPLKAYLPPSFFAHLKAYALKLGFKAVMSGPYVRSSYLAHQL